MYSYVTTSEGQFFINKFKITSNKLTIENENTVKIFDFASKHSHMPKFLHS